MKAFYKIILLLYGCYFSLAATAQNLNLVSPITISMPNTPAANTDDWGKGAQTIIITAKKNTPNELQSWMLVTIKKGGSKICGSNTPQTAPEVYFDVPLKTWVGTTATSLLGNGCVLQPGDYELCVQFYLKDRRTIIGENCKSFTIQASKDEKYSPPVNISPVDKKVFDEKEIKAPITFRWTPIIPKPQNSVIYKLQVWSVMQGQTPSQAIQTTQLIIQEEVKDQTQFMYRKGWDGTVKGGYVWRVEATDGQGKVLGVSEATSFSVGNEEKNSPQKTNEKFLPTPQNELPTEIQKLIKEQDIKLNKSFEYKTKQNQKTASLCNFEITELDIQCKGKDNQGNKKYHIVLTYKNNSTTGASRLGKYTTPCIATTTNGNYVGFLSSSSATITPGTLFPAIGASTIIPLGTSINISFDFVPIVSGPLDLIINGYNIISSTGCGNCDDIISLKLPNCCYPCDENPVTANSISTTQLDPIAGTIKIINSIASPKNITRIDADIVSVKYFPITSDCIKCNNQNINQDNFIGLNNISGAGWNSSGNPALYLGENTLPNTSRSLVFTSTSSSGVNLSAPANLTHTIGVSPNSCCGDSVEIWIRYSVWDKDCHICDKLVKSVISRTGTCTGTNGGGGGTLSPQIPSKN